MNPLDQPATSRDVRELYERRILNREQAAHAERLVRSDLEWRAWIERLLLFLGAALLLAGVIFFFAYNWHRLAPREKFLTVEIAMLLCAGAAWRLRESLPGKVCLLAASVLTGVFLAVFGQVYQTGADAWQLFAAWMLLILPWTLFSRFGAQWILWIALANVALALFWQQELFPARWNIERFPDLTASLGVLNGLALAAREIALRGGARWLAEDWLRWLLSLATFTFLTVANCALVWEDRNLSDWGFPIVALLIALALSYWSYRVKMPSLSCLAIAALSFSIVLAAFLGHLLLEDVHDPIGIFFLLGVIVLAIFGGAVFWLRSVVRAFREGAGT